MLGKLSLILWLGRAYNYELSFEWKRQVITFASRTSVIIKNEPVQVDPQLMFQRLHAIATRETNENPTSLFKYELCLV